MPNWTAYKAIKTEAKRQGLPRLFPTDISVHDRAILARKNAPDCFGWILTTCGTYFLRPGAVDALPTARYHRRSNDARYYWYEGGLAAATPEQVIANLEGQ